MTVTGPVRISKFANGLYVVRTAWSDTLDLRQKVKLANTVTWNGTAATSAINFENIDLIPVATTDGNSYGAAASTSPASGVGDDYCPITINGSYVGAGHGFSVCVKVTATGHGKAAVDVGSEWLNSSGHKWYIVKIIDANNLLMLSENTGSGTGVWAFRTWTASATLTHSAGATNTGDITVGSTTASQYLWPAYVREFAAVVLDGETAIQADGYYACNYADFIEQYRIFDPTSVLAYLIANRGSNPAPTWAAGTDIATQATVSNTYRYTRNGACTVYQRVTLTKESVYTNGVVQAGPLDAPASGSVYQYIPGAAAFSIGANAYDFAAGQTLATQLDIVTLTSARWASATVPPDRFVQIRQAADTTRDYGFALGFAPVSFGAAAERKDRIDSAYTIASAVTKKSYPRFIGGNSTDYPTGTPAAASEFTATAFRVPFAPGAAGAPTYAAWYMVGNDAYAMIEAHADFAGSVTLDASLAGRAVSIVASQGTIALAGTRVSAAGAVAISVTGYGSAVVKLSTVPADVLATVAVTFAGGGKLIPWGDGSAIAHPTKVVYGEAAA